MKKYNFALLVLFLCLGLACSKNDDNGATNPPQSVDKSANLLGTGDSANDILSNGTFNKLLVEIAYVEGFRPAPASIASFEAYLKEHTFKEDIEVIYNELPSPNKETLSIQEIADLESENRTAYNDGETLAIYIYFADAPSDDDDEEQGLVTLGAVYRNTSMVIHEITVVRLAGRSLLITETDVEVATLNHEFGHLFGLVNLGTTPVNNHEDLEARNHCNVEGCLMRAELQFGAADKSTFATTSKAAEGAIKVGCQLSGASVMNMLTRQIAKGNNITPLLDAECMLDLQSNGGR